MSTLSRRSLTLTLIAVVGFVPATLAGDVKASKTDDGLAQLETLLEAQQHRLESLQQQLVATDAQEGDAARTEAMRKQIREILNEQEFRESLMPSTLQAGYDKGFYIRSSDDKFKMAFHGRMQMRWTYYDTQSRNHYTLPRRERDDMTGFEVKRLRLSIDGNVYNKDLTYLLEMQSDAPSAYDTRVLYAWLNYRFVDEFQVKVGIMQLAGPRAGFQSSSNMQFPEYPLTEAVFGPDTGTGIRLWGQLFGKRLEYFLDVMNSVRGAANRVITTDAARELDNNPGILFRTVWHALGENPPNDCQEWGDTAIHQSPALDIGFHYIFNQDNGDARTMRLVFNRQSLLPGGFGAASSNGTQINQFGLDSVFKWQGFSLSGEYIMQIVDPRNTDHAPFTPVWVLSGDDSTVMNNGAYVQTGYFLPIPGLEKKLELVARAGGISTNIGGAEGTWFYAGGVNYYFEGNKVKLQTDVEKVYEMPLSSTSWLGNVNDDAVIWRVQLQFSF
jgi:hypothetical protein